MTVQKGLPAGWYEASLAEVAWINPRTADPVPTDDQPVSFVPMAAVEAGSGRLDASDVRPWKEVKKGYTRFQEGDVLFAKITPCMENGKAAIASGLSTGTGAGSTEFHVLRPTGPLEPKLLLHYLLQEEFRKSARARMTGTAGQLRVPTLFLEERRIPVPPLLEQHRMVEAIESYFTRLDDAVANLERVQRKLKRYRASVLKAAVEGRLVPTEAELARAEGRDYEPASVLLERILAERRRRWEENELVKMKAKGKTPTDGKWKAKYQEPAAATAKLPELPEGWCWASIDQMAEVVRNGYSKKPESTGNVRILRISAVRSMSVDFRDARWLPGTVDDYTSDLIRAGDLLFTRYNGTPELVGVSGLVRAVEQPTVHPDKLIKVRLFDSFLEVPYIELATNTGLSRRHVEERIRTTAGQAGISGSDIKKMPVPFPPAPEQRRIADEVGRLLSLADDARHGVQASSRRADRLRQSILKWAFEGRLVEQDPTEEPASALLERIKSESSASAATRKNKNPRRSTNA